MKKMLLSMLAASLAAFAMAADVASPIQRSPVDELESVNAQIKQLENQRTSLDGEFPGKKLGYRMNGSTKMHSMPVKGKVPCGGVVVREGDDERKAKLTDIEDKLIALYAQRKELRKAIDDAEKEKKINANPTKEASK